MGDKSTKDHANGTLGARDTPPLGSPDNPRVVKPKNPKESWADEANRRGFDRAKPLPGAKQRVPTAKPLKRSTKTFGKPKEGSFERRKGMYREDI